METPEADDELCELLELMLCINVNEPRLMRVFFAACKDLDDLPASEGLGAGFILYRAGEPLPRYEELAKTAGSSTAEKLHEVLAQNRSESITMHAPVTDAELFLAVRDVLSSDGSLQRWRELRLGYHELCLALRHETIRLLFGDDPRQPW